MSQKTGGDFAAAFMATASVADARRVVMNLFQMGTAKLVPMLKGDAPFDDHMAAFLNTQREHVS